MKKRSFLIMMILSVMMLVSGCTQEMTKSFGGDMTLHLEPNTKLEEITWKDDNLWYLTRPMTEDDIAVTHTFQQKSEFGIFEGTVTIIETVAEPDAYAEYMEWKKKEPMTYDEYLLYKKHDYTINDILNGRVDYSILYGTENIEE